jgi:hypothetical protein
MKIRLSLLACVLGTVFLTGSAQATVMTYSNTAAFDAATTSQVTNGFSAGGNEDITLGSPGSTTVGDVTLDATSGTTYIIGTSFVNTYGADFFSAQNASSHEAITFSFSTPVDAFAFDYGSYNDRGDNLQLALSSGNTINLTLPGTPGTAEFIGLTSDTGITSASLTDQGTGDVLDVISVTTADLARTSAVPEPSSLPMLLAGLGMIGGAFYFGRKKAKSI